MTLPDHLFIVGMDRTGSTLTKEILNCSEAVGLAGEPQYFRRRPHWSLLPDRGHRGLIKKIGDKSTNEGAKKVVDHLFQDPENYTNFWRFSRNGFDREAFLDKLLKTYRTDRDLLDLALEFHARGKPVRGDKTPANIYFVPVIMEWFPNTKFIQTFRDPRAIYISRKHKKEKFEMPAINRMLRKTGIIFEFYASSRLILDWKQSIRFHRKYKDCYPGRYYLSKYEDLIQDPESAIRDMCNFLEINFIPEMLHQQVVNSSFVSGERSTSGFDHSAIDRWRKHIHPMINQWITSCCKNQLLEYGYPL